MTDNTDDFDRGDRDVGVRRGWKAPEPEAVDQRTPEEVRQANYDQRVVAAAAIHPGDIWGGIGHDRRPLAEQTAGHEKKGLHALRDDERCSRDTGAPGRTRKSHVNEEVHRRNARSGQPGVRTIDMG